MTLYVLCNWKCKKETPKKRSFIQNSHTYCSGLIHGSINQSNLISKALNHTQRHLEELCALKSWQRRHEATAAEEKNSPVERKLCSRRLWPVGTAELASSVSKSHKTISHRSPTSNNDPSKVSAFPTGCRPSSHFRVRHHSTTVLHSEK